MGFSDCGDFGLRPHHRAEDVKIFYQLPVLFMNKWMIRFFEGSVAMEEAFMMANLLVVMYVISETNITNTMKKKLYIVSFGDSDQYKYRVGIPDSEISASHSDPVEKITVQLTERLNAALPDAKNLKEIVSPKVTEVSPEDIGRFAAYPELDEKALADIEKELVRETEVRASLHELNNNAPFSDI